MTDAALVTPNRRGVKSRERVLDAAEEVMATEGFEAASVARVVEVSGVPVSSVYHYFGSKDGILLAVMERGARRFFAELPPPGPRRGRAVEHLHQVFAAVTTALERNPSFLRLLVVFAVQPPPSDDGRVAAVVDGVRETARDGLRTEIAIAFGDDRRSRVTDQLVRLALAAFDGAFIAWQSDPGVRLARLLAPLPDALAGARRALVADRARRTNR
jgi:AcrR family transcriptional regulator